MADEDELFTEMLVASLNTETEVAKEVLRAVLEKRAAKLRLDYG